MNRMIRIGLLLCAAAALLGAMPARTAPSAARWPVPKGWASETIPFPLEFAPDVKLQGSEELRMAPGFLKPDAPDYWSYAFAWSLEGSPDLGKEALQRHLTRYYAGLCQAVGGTKYRFDPARYQVKLDSEPVPALAGPHPGKAFAGTVRAYDPFATGKELTLNVEVRVWECPPTKRHVVMVTASPAAKGKPMWDDLAACRRAYACHP